MKIHEILDSDVKYEVVTDSDKLFKTRSEPIGERVITFMADLDDEDTGEWDVVFWQSDLTGKGMKFHATKSGNELEVFSMVKSSMLEFIRKRNPKKIKFNADKVSDGSRGTSGRADLYHAFLKRFKLPNYKYEREVGGSDDYYSLTRQD